MTFFFNLPLLTQIITIYLLAINVITFFFFGLDKMQAQLAHRRTPEKVLWILTLIGGSVGALSGMKFFRHKTKKISFQMMIVLILIAQMLLLYGVFLSER